jgi:hypothetical protein
MTRAPANLLAVRRLLLDHLGPGVKPPPGVTILDPLGDPAWEIGIVPDAAHRGGYHCGSDRVIWRNGVIDDYSVVESPRDRNGLTLDAAALDIGMFKVRTPKGTFDLRHYSTWMVQQCQAGTADTAHIREIIYSPDGKTVKRWDRLGRRSSGDNSHLTHTHESYFRDAIRAGYDVSAVKRRYLTVIGALGGTETSTGGDDVSRHVRHGDKGENVRDAQFRLNRLGIRTVNPNKSKGDPGYGTAEPLTTDGIYKDHMAAAVVAFEKSVNPAWTGDGRSILAATWTRMDDAYWRQLIAQHAPKPAQPAVDYAQLAGAVDLAQVAARIDTTRLAADLDYRRFAIAVLQALPANAS